MFSTARYAQIATGEGRSLVLKELPAIYAWYRSVELVAAAGSATSFLAAIDGLLSAKLSDRCRGRLGYLYEVSIQETGGPLGQRSRSVLERISADPSARARIAGILQAATYLQAPIYVGKALDLRRRVGEHVTGSTGLLQRLLEAAVPMEQCVLRYRYIDEDDVNLIAAAAGLSDDAHPADTVAVLIEELLTRLSPSAFVRRPG